MKSNPYAHDPPEPELEHDELIEKLTPHMTRAIYAGFWIGFLIGILTAVGVWFSVSK